MSSPPVQAEPAPAASAGAGPLEDRSAAAGPVVVTGAGGPAGVAVVQALMAAGEEVVAVDADPAAAGFLLAAQHAVVPTAGSGQLVAALVDLADTFGTVGSALVPTVAEELTELFAGRHHLTNAGVRHWLPRPEAVDRCVDKAVFAAAMVAAGVPVPATFVPGDAADGPPSADGPGRPGHRGSIDALVAAVVAAVDGPWIVKPRRGRGSRHVVAVDDRDQLAAALALVPDPIVQHRAVGTEFTADALVGPDGLPAAVVCRWRLETRGGISTRGQTFEDPAIRAAVEASLTAVGLTGPANVQGFAGPDGVLITEINPRFSGGLPLSLASGADLVGEYLQVVRGGSLRPERLVGRSGVSMTRWFADHFSWPEPGTTGHHPGDATTRDPAASPGAGRRRQRSTPPFRAVLFDLDDTLVPQGPWLDGALQAAAAAAVATDPSVDGRRLLAALRAQAAQGSARGNVIDKALADVGADLPVAPLVAAFLAYRPARLEPDPAAVPLLTRLAGTVPVAVVTDGNAEMQRAKLRISGLERLVDAVVCCDDLGRRHRKPAPLPFRTALAALGVPAGQAVFVGDRPDTDIVGAAGCGLATVRVRTGEHRHRPCPVPPTVEVDDLAAAAAWLADRLG
jgi:carbamoyl-phosphate synthase large subunit